MTAYNRRYYAGGGVTTTLASGMGGSDTSFTVAAATGWPGGEGNPFFVVIDRWLPAEEKILCASNSGTTVTVASSGRGADGTGAATHLIGASVSLCLSAQDADEANQIVVQLMGKSGITAGDLFYVSGTSPTAYTRLPIGSSGQVLTVASSAPSWAAGSGGGGGGANAPLARTYYNPASQNVQSNATTSVVVVDSANMTVGFTPPGPLVYITFELWMTGNGEQAYLCAVTHGTTTIVSDAGAIQAAAVAVAWGGAQTRTLKMAVTPNTAYQIDLAGYNTGAGSYTAIIGGAYGPGIITVWAN